MCAAKPLSQFFEKPSRSDGSLRRVPERDWHTFDADAVVPATGADPSRGLTTTEVTQRQLRYGLNALQEIRARPARRILVDQFASIVIALLAVAAVVSGVTGDRLESIAILVVLVINALVGFATEWQASRALDALRRQARTSARVRREGLIVLKLLSTICNELDCLQSQRRGLCL